MMLQDFPAAPRWRRLAALTLGGLGLLLLWDASGLDLALARLAAGPGGFPWRDRWLPGPVLHDGGRWLALAVAGWLAAGIQWPTGVLRRLPRGERVQWFATVLLALVLIALLKAGSQTSCPWDLAEFGGVAAHQSHWRWGLPDGGPGRCFPAGHASAGFAFIGGFFALRGHAPRAARVALWLSVAAGVLLGAAQQLRGAHFMSHTLWTGWICWTTALAVARVAATARVAAPSGAPA